MNCTESVCLFPVFLIILVCINVLKIRMVYSSVLLSVMSLNEFVFVVSHYMLFCYIFSGKH
jgi:hypothetical protein